MASEKNVYRLQNLSCTSCAAKFEKNVRQIDTVEDVQLNFGASKLTVAGNASIVQLEEAGAFDGIKVFPEKQRIIKQHTPFWKKRENQTTIASLVLLLAGYAVSTANGDNNWLSIALFLSAIIIGGFSLMKEGLTNLFKLEFDMSTLMTIAVIGAALIGDWAEGAVVVFLFSVSEALESYSIDKARNSITSLIEIAPTTATVLRGNNEFEVDVEDLRIDDVILIKPGQKIAMDGEVIQGDSSVNQAAITGESVPVHKVLGDEVFAGTLNEEGAMHVRVTKLAEDTTIAKIIHLVEEAQAEKAPTQQFVDRFARFYTPAILVISLLIMIIPPLLMGGVWGEWFYKGLVVLVVGCPCALVISTPIAIVTAIGNAARNGVLIKGGIHLEETGQIKVVAFDKTGTLTEGRPEVTDVLTVSSLTEDQIVQRAASIEKFSQHPLASSIMRAAKKLPLGLLPVHQFQSITGKGAKAVIGEHLVHVGSPKLFREMNTVEESIDQQILTLQKQGKTVMLVWSETGLEGIIAVADQVRKSSLYVIQKLHEMGKKTVMLTGDNQSTALAIGAQLGLTEVKAELLPDQKVEMIKSLSQYGKVAMVGDGVNDAPALATANIGIAMGGAGTDTALETADIALMADDLEKLPYTIKLSSRTKQIILQNISIALGLKVIALLLIVPGWLTLWMAVMADMGATVIVVLNSLRLMKNNI
ncbi:heavy metal translocating P-type ATPase [Sporosarcina sp. P21c]|uniref:heavy metal translocating P-type ATPase n=1 Tax=unclassified Sporosarcina TaxID=2647733 RepID=UPI000C16E53A|nr:MULTISPECIES: heavy metal translocating P-type ATPase [unclassified Sporosarcina]PIC66552.1 heavy metal translocating P-type ATPase [Sporosarcina sp. P16a]PIC89956.1 heavy metal translocating P-type ATPase [Sporosarcina sp. P21c]PIC93151.1 heavy metal translocating P-type ATPase [Sporosarcina sp. P25]